jgi:hypothetical protein
VLRHRGLARLVAYGASAAFPALATNRRFVIYSTGRAGTQYLGQLLDSHPLIKFGGELLHAPTRWPERLIKGRTVLARRLGVNVFGVKVLRRDLTEPDRQVVDPKRFVARMHGQGYEFIWLHRENAVLQALSRIHGETSGFHFWGRGRPRFESLTVDPGQVIAYASRFEAHAALIAEDMATVPHVALTYDDDLVPDAARIRTLERLCDLFELPYHEMTSDLVTVAPRRIADRVANYDELVAALRGTPLARYLEPSQPPT